MLPLVSLNRLNTSVVSLCYVINIIRSALVYFLTSVTVDCEGTALFTAPVTAQSLCNVWSHRSTTCRHENSVVHSSRKTCTCPVLCRKALKKNYTHKVRLPFFRFIPKKTDCEDQS